MPLSFQDKITPVQAPTSAPSGGLSFASKITPVAGAQTSFKYDVPVNRVALKSNLQNQAAQSKAESDSANSVGGFIKNAFAAPSSESLPFIGGALALAKTAN